MKKFVLIDHSLKAIGGHHYDYARLVLSAAEKAGYQVVLASHRRFARLRNVLPQHWSVLPLFPHSTYNKYALYAGSRSRSVRKSQQQSTSADRVSAEEVNVQSVRQGFSWWQALGRRRVVNGFARACRRLFREIDLAAGDQVFVPTLSELDLEGLVRFLEKCDAVACADWHLQFHYNIFEGREPDYACQADRLQRVREQFRDALDRLPERRLHFYNTSEQLNAQYDRLGVARFENLAYPINPAFTTPAKEQDRTPPLRVVCGGAIRAEKGHQHLSTLVEELWPEYLSTGKLQLRVQSNKSWFRLPLPDGEEAVRQRPYLPDTDCSDPLLLIRHPLDVDDYVRHIQRADIGLMLYDSRRYYVRRAGVLGEYLACGTPVIVPAGCWLSEQIAEPNFQHLERMESLMPAIPTADIDWQRGLDNALVEVGNRAAAAVCQVTFPPSATDLRVDFQWVAPIEPGTYLRLCANQFDAQERLVARSEAIVGRRQTGGRGAALLHRHADAVRMEISWENAYDDGRVVLSEPRFSCFDAKHLPGEHCPAGAVGLTFADPQQIPRLLANVADHYEYYRRAAADFSHDWRRRHDADATLAQLLDNAARSVGGVYSDAA